MTTQATITTATTTSEHTDGRETGKEGCIVKPTKRGVSFGTVFMLAVTVLVVGLSAAILPRLLGTADFRVDVSSAFSVLTLNDSLPALAMNSIPISDATPTPVPTAQTAAPAATASPTPTPTATPVPGGTITLTIGGTVNVETAIRQSAYYSESKKYDFTEIMMLLTDEMSADLTLLTLENLTNDAQAVSELNAPSAVMDMLADAGVDIVALGFPKAYEQGGEGLNATIAAARDSGLDTLGAYADQADADKLRLFTVDGVKVAFLHFTSSVSATGKKNLSKEGAAYALPLIDTTGTMLAQVRKARESADVVVVSLNWGKTSASKPTVEQKELAQELADAGADLIVGAGTRVVQPITWLTAKDGSGSIRHVLCAWGLGTLISDSRKDGNVAGMLLQLQISYDGSSLSFEKVCYTPTYVWRYKQDGQYQYRIAVSDQPAPDGMSDDQAGYMAKAYRNLQKYLDGSPVTLRTK